MKVETHVLGPLATNTYVLDIDGELLIIDPAGKKEKLTTIIGDRKPLGVLLTHGHFDHIKTVDGLYEQYHCPIYIHPADEAMTRDPQSGKLFGLVAYISSPLTHLEEGEMKIGPFTFEVIYTPGHTEGSVIFVFSDCIFTGDTLFKGSAGRTDLEGGNESKLHQSLQVFKHFEKDYLIYPGHDQSTTLSMELLNNWYLR